MGAEHSVNWESKGGHPEQEERVEVSRGCIHVGECGNQGYD